MTSLLPGQILPPSTPLGTVKADGTVQIEQNWWLLIFNLCQQVLGTNGGLSSAALQDLSAADSDAADSDAIALRRPLANALIQAIQPSDVVLGLDDLPDLQRALLLAQDGLLPDPPALAQPVAAISPTGSPFTYMAPFSGSVALTGSITSITLVRQGTSVATGLTTGLVPVARQDQLVVTYPGSAPTMTFIPGSIA